MNRRATSPQAASHRRTALLALVAVFWLAQLQGLSHVVSHLGRDHAAPHSLVCGACIASADAGAGPLLVVALPPLVGTVAAPPQRSAGAEPTARVTTAYRSRAPPSTPC